MTDEQSYKNPAGSMKARPPAGFIAICIIAFIAGLLLTVCFYRAMCCDMTMPGGWTMSMMWMQMPGQTWLESGIMFALMWLAMMVPMMMPSALPTFLKTGRKWAGLCYMAFGYFAVWLVAGVIIYPPGMALAAAAMQSQLFSHTVPLFLGTILIIAGAVQFTRWKMTHLLRCRSPYGCAISCAPGETSFRLGCKQGKACFLCCAGPMSILLALGVMNPFAMVAVTIIITAEKLLPRPEITARIVGVVAILAGVATIVQWAAVMQLNT